MLHDPAATHSKMKIAFVPTISVLLLLCGLLITGQHRDEKLTDGPISVKLGDIYQKGTIKVELADSGTLPALPPDYMQIPKMAYRITTDAVAVGPYTVVFGVPSITDEDTFNKLRILHAEPDEFDPDTMVWVDRTGRSHDAPPSDFSQKTIAAHSDELWTGIYIVAKLTGKITPNKAVADLEVVDRSASEAVQMPAYITLSVIVKNNGPQPATDVGLKHQLQSGAVVSMKPSQGSCKVKSFRVYCKLGRLLAGDSATLAVEIDPSPDFAGEYRSFVEVAAKEADSNPDNNRVEASADTLGDPNLPPIVTLEAPLLDQVFEHRETVTLKATATDPDGTITKVEFLDNDEIIGIGETADNKHFSLSSTQVKNGRHVLNAIAIDNGGRRTRSNAQHIFVNGPIKVQVLKPNSDSELKAGSDLILTAIATNPSGSIEKVEFFYNGGFSLGQAVTSGDNRYTIKISNLAKTNYTVHAVATDDAGLVSKSAELRFRVTK